METGLIIFIVLVMKMLMLHYQKYHINIICSIITLSLPPTHLPTHTKISNSPLTALELFSQNNEDITVNESISSFLL